MDKFNLLKQYLITHLQNGGRVRKLSFTMAEILLSLTIIGVVAAITLPSLTGNINERTWDTQRKALHNRLTQAIKVMPSLNGYGTYTYSTADNGTTSATADTAAITFVTEGLSKVLKLNQICDADNMEKCGIPNTFKRSFNISVNTTFPKALQDLSTMLSTTDNPHKYVNTRTAAFLTKNGESVAVYYNPFCVSEDAIFLRSSNSEYVRRRAGYIQPYMCVNFIYDLNGKKGPNRMGKDLGVITAFYSSDPIIVAPLPIARDTSGILVNYNTAMAQCRSYEGYKLPNIEELMSIALNRNILLNTSSSDWQSSTIIKVPEMNYKTAWVLNMSDGYRFINGAGSDQLLNKRFTCVKH